MRRLFLQRAASRIMRNACFHPQSFRQVLLLYRAAIFHIHRVLHDVLQLSNVTGPSIIIQYFQRLIAEPLHGLAHYCIELSQRAVQHISDILSTLSQRRYMQRDHVQPEIQILPEFTAGYHLFEILIGSCDYTYIYIQ